MSKMLQGLDIFYGKTSETAAQVYARVPRGEHSSELRLSGRVRGPHCQKAKTLPSTLPLDDLGPGATLLARVEVPDPCFWSIDLPAWYDVIVELREGDQIVETAEQQLGIRQFGPRGKDIYFNSRRCVLRGVWRHAAKNDKISEWRDTRTAIFAELPDERLCEEASHEGVLVVARLHGSASEISAHLRRLTKWPAVAMAIIANDSVPDSIVEVAPNILLAQTLDDQGPVQPGGWASLLAAQVTSLEVFAALTKDVELPIIALRDYDEPSTVAELRSRCDQLQRDLAPFGDFAGYVV